METGELIAIIIVAIVLILGTLFICYRCWSALAEVAADKNKPGRQDTPFTRAFGQSLRRSFRNSFRSSFGSSFRNSFRGLRRGKSGAPGVQSGTLGATQATRPQPRATIATIEDLKAEKSQLHPYFLQPKPEAPPSYEETFRHDRYAANHRPQAKHGSQSQPQRHPNKYDELSSHHKVPIVENPFDPHVEEFREKYVGDINDEGGFAVATERNGCASPIRARRIHHRSSQHGSSGSSSHSSPPNSMFDNPAFRGDPAESGSQHPKPKDHHTQPYPHGGHPHPQPNPHRTANLPSSPPHDQNIVRPRPKPGSESPVKNSPIKAPQSEQSKSNLDYRTGPHDNRSDFHDNKHKDSPPGGSYDSRPPTNATHPSSTQPQSHPSHQVEAPSRDPVVGRAVAPLRQAASMRGGQLAGSKVNYNVQLGIRFPEDEMNALATDTYI